MRFVLANDAGYDEPLIVEAVIDGNGNAALLINGWYTVGVSTDGRAILFSSIPEDLGLDVDEDGELNLTDEKY